MRSTFSDRQKISFRLSKPLLKEENAMILCTESLEAIGDRIFIKSIVSFGLVGEDKMICCHATGKSLRSLRACQAPQITGACSSLRKEVCARVVVPFGRWCRCRRNGQNQEGAEKPELTPDHPLWDQGKGST